MKRTLLIRNANSGSAGALDEGQLSEGLRKAGFDPVRSVELPDADLPKRADVERDNIEVVAIVSGDGTISSVCAEMSGWDGALLVLPGGTMNLLSRRLHGELDLAAVMEKLAAAETLSGPVPVIKLADREILTGLTAGPSTEWGKVREGIRQGDVGDLVEKVPEAWTETISGEGVRVKGDDNDYPSIFVEPFDANNLAVTGFKAEGIKDMLAHGVAWLRGDFREGPRDDLGKMPELVIAAKGRHIGLLVDGEQEDGQSPLSCHAGMSSVNFVRMVE